MTELTRDEALVAAALWAGREWTWEHAKKVARDTIHSNRSASGEIRTALAGEAKAGMADSYRDNCVHAWLGREGYTICEKCLADRVDVERNGKPTGFVPSVVRRVSALEAENARLAHERDAWRSSSTMLAAERDGLREERDTAVTQRDEFQRRMLEAQKERDEFKAASIAFDSTGRGGNAKFWHDRWADAKDIYKERDALAAKVKEMEAKAAWHAAESAKLSNRLSAIRAAAKE